MSVTINPRAFEEQMRQALPEIEKDNAVVTQNKESSNKDDVVAMQSEDEDTAVQTKGNSCNESSPSLFSSSST